MSNLLNIKLSEARKQTWKENFSYDSSYQIFLELYKDSYNKTKINSTYTDDGFEFTFNDQSLTSGNYNYQFLAVDINGNYELIESGTIFIFPNYEREPQGYWRLVYNNWKEAYLKLSTREAASVSVMGQSVTYQDLNKVLKHMLDAEYKMREEELNEKTTYNKIYKARFR